MEDLRNGGFKGEVPKVPPQLMLCPDIFSIKDHFKLKNHISSSQKIEQNI